MAMERRAQPSPKRASTARISIHKAGVSARFEARFQQMEPMYGVNGTSSYIKRVGAAKTGH